MLCASSCRWLCRRCSPASARRRVFVISTTTIASLAGFSGSLGDIIANETSYHFSGVLGAAICVAGLALTVEGAADARAARAHAPRPAPARSAAAHAGAASPSGVARIAERFMTQPTTPTTRRRRMQESNWRRHRAARTRALVAVVAASRASRSSRVAAAAARARAAPRRARPRRAAARPRPRRSGRQRPGVGKPAVTIGDKNFTEENILGELYAQALQGEGLHASR